MAKHFAKCPKCGHALEVDTAVDGAITCPSCRAALRLPGTPTSTKPPDPLIGTTLAEFEILELLGRGGMGAVYKGRQASLDRFVAIKTLPRGLAANKDFVERFYREARTAASLRHTHLVQVYAVGQAQGIHYIAMEFVDGEGLDAVARRDGPLAPDRALTILKQVCQALAVAHAAGIVHRDIKPSNLMLDADAQVRITDFGLAKHTEGDITVTQTGQSVGSPLYMAPEMAKGGDADARADLYSLGATFHHLLAGHAPFEGETFSELIIKHVNEPPTPLAQAAPHVDPRLCRIIDQLLRKNPDARFPTAQAVLDELDALGELKTTGHAAKAQARTMIVGASTRTMAQDPQIERQAALDARARHQKARKRRNTLVGAIASIALLLVAGVVIWAVTRKGDAKLPAKAAVPPLPPAKSTPKEDKAEGAALGAKITATRPVPKPLDRPKPPEGPAPPDDQAPGWVSLFDGKTLDGWKVVDKFLGAGAPGTATAADGQIVLEKGKEWAAVSCTREFPPDDYEVEFEAVRLEGNGPFSLMIFPLGGRRATLDIGGWGGTVVGIAGLDGKHAHQNETTRRIHFQNGRWYRVRLRVAAGRIQLWVDGQTMFDLATAGHRFGVLTMMREIQRFGVASGTTRAALRKVRLRRVHEAAPAAEAAKWASLFDGKSLGRWRIVREMPSAPVQGKVVPGGSGEVADGRLALDRRDGYVGALWTGECPTDDYEFEVETMRVEGRECFCHVMFPVGGSTCALLLSPGGANRAWLAYVDRKLPPAPEMSKPVALTNGKWYRVRVRVADGKIAVAIDGTTLFDLPQAGHSFSVFPALKPVTPLGLALFRTKSAFRGMRLRRLKQQELAAEPIRWVSLFDGNSLEGWRVAKGGFFKPGGAVRVADGCLVLDANGDLSAGATCTREVPGTDYEVEFEAMRTRGKGSAASLVFPVADGHCAWHIGNYLRSCGLDRVNGLGDLSRKNPTRRLFTCANNHWYRFRLRVERDRVQGWIDDERVVDIATKGHTFSIWAGYAGARPLGFLAARHTEARVRKVRIRPLHAPPPATGLGPMVRKPVEPFEATFDEDEKRLTDWEPEAGDWTVARGELMGTAQGNGWLTLRGRRLGDFVLEADAIRTGQKVGFAYGLVFRRIGRYELMFSLSAQGKSVTLRGISDYVPQPKGPVPGVTIRRGKKALRPKAGQRYRMKVECVGTRVRCYLDDELVGEATDTALLTGKVALFVHRAQVRFDNVRVRPAAEKPRLSGPALAKLFERRAERVEGVTRVSDEVRLRAWDDFLERWPKAAAQRVAKARQRRDHWKKVVAETIGVATDRSKALEAQVFSAPVRQLADGRMSVKYNAAKPIEYYDWETVRGYCAIHGFGVFDMNDLLQPLNAICWKFRHGSDVGLDFHALAKHTYGCTLFAQASAPLDTGIVLTVGADNNRATTLGPAGAKPWFRGDVVPEYEWQRHHLEVRGGELVYKVGDKEVFRRKIDLGLFPGRRLALWSRLLPTLGRRFTRLDRVFISSARQHDWTASHRPGGPPQRRSDQPDASGWLGMVFPDGGTTKMVGRSYAVTSWGHMAILDSPRSYGWINSIAPHGAMRDGIVSTRLTFLTSKGYAYRSGVGLVFRRSGELLYTAVLRHIGGAELIQRSKTPEDGNWRSDVLARSREFRLPAGMLHLVAVFKTGRIDIYCNGKHVLGHDGLREVKGNVGIEAAAAKIIVHDFKFRPLPSDPLFGKLYGGKKP